MKNITVSIDESTYRMARVRAAELDTSVSALVREYLRILVQDRSDPVKVDRQPVTKEVAHNNPTFKEVVEEIRARNSGFSAADNFPREVLYDRTPSHRGDEEGMSAAVVSTTPDQR